MDIAAFHVNHDWRFVLPGLTSEGSARSMGDRLFGNVLFREPGIYRNQEDAAALQDTATADQEAGSAGQDIGRACEILAQTPDFG